MRPNNFLSLKNRMEIDFLKTKSYEEINDMFNSLHNDLKSAKSEIEYFKKNNIEPTELLLSYTEHIKKYNELTETVNKNDVEAFLIVYNSKKL